MNTANTFHFSLGENLGDTLFDIACEHVRKGDIKKAMSVYSENLEGISEDLIKKILKGECSLKTSEDGQTLELSKEKVDEFFVRDWHKLLDLDVENISETLEAIEQTRKSLLRRRVMDPNDFSIRELDSVYTAEIKAAAKLLVGGELFDEDFSVWETLENNYADYVFSREEAILYELVEYVNLIRNLHEAFMKLVRFYEALKHFELIDKYSFIEMVFEKCLDVLDRFSDQSKGYHHPMVDEKLNDYKIKMWDEVLSTEVGKTYARDGILPKNPEDFYDGAWISPDGTFYGAIGESNQLLHLQLADRICKKMTLEDEDPDYWLSSKGWLKIHGRQALGFFAHSKEEAKEMNTLYAPSKQQIETLCKYMDMHFNGKFISEKRDLSTREIKQMDEIALHEAFRF